MKIQSSKPWFPAQMRQKILSEIDKAMQSGHLTMGPWIDRFEEAFARFIGCRYAVAVNSGTSALEILLRYFNVCNHEVIVPTNTFSASANAVIFAGGTPVLADIHPETLCIDPQELERRCSDKTKGVIVVHIAGLPCPHMENLWQFCKEKGLFLIEDAAHAAGAGDGVKMAGNLADGGAFSFFPTKILTTGEGGMLTTNDEKCARFARSLRCHGITVSGDDAPKGQFTRLGYNWRMSEIQAIIGFFQLKILKEAVLKRQEIAAVYRNELSKNSCLRLIKTPADYQHSYYKFPVILPEKVSRDVVTKSMRENFAVQCGTIYWPPVHLQPFYRNHFNYKPGDLPVAEKVLNRTLALPIFPELTSDEASFVVQSLQESLVLVQN